MTLSLQAYARLLAELIAAGESRADVLARNGLDEASWEAADTDWQARLSAALAAPGEGVSPLISDYAAAYQAAQRALGPPISLETFAAVTRALRHRTDLQTALAEAGIPLQAYVRGSEHWSPRLASDPEIAARFTALLRGQSPS